MINLHFSDARWHYADSHSTALSNSRLVSTVVGLEFCVTRVSTASPLQFFYCRQIKPRIYSRYYDLPLDFELFEAMRLAARDLMLWSRV